MNSKIPLEIMEAIDKLIELRIKHFDVHNQMCCMGPTKSMMKQLKEEISGLEDDADKQRCIIFEGLSRVCS